MEQLEDLLTFVRVAETRNLSRAADRLGVSKSVVSRRLDRLERDLNVRLLHRSTRGVRPTEAGAAFERRCSRLFAELEEARNEVAGRDGQLIGPLRIAAPVSFGLRYLAPALATFAAKHASLSLDVSYADWRVDLIGEGFDAAVRIGVPSDSRLVARHLTRVRLVLVGSPAYLAKRGTPRAPADLAAHAGLVSSQAGSADNLWRFGSADGPRVSIPDEIRLRSDNGEALLEGAVAGLGLTVLPTFIVADAVRAGRLVPLLRDCPLPERSLCVLRPPGAATAKVRALFDELAACFGPEPQWDRGLFAEATEA